jgi:3-oxoacyl-[acyl-carrier protein] reductase
MSKPMNDFAGQLAVVTGGTRGIGAAISQGLLVAGAHVAAIYEKNEESATALRQRCEAHGERLTLHRLDVSDHHAVQAFYASLDGAVQILVNNSGIRQDALLGLMAKESWDRVLAVNLSGAYHMCKFAVRAMMSGRYGRIINVTSPAGSFGFAGQSNYAASKAGLVAMTRSLAREVATKGITVNCVSPGFILTDLIKDLPLEKLAFFKSEVPMGRFGTPEEVAAAVLFLASREASYISGSTLGVTGGIAPT